MFCPTCGQELSPQARFCRNCGAAVTAAAPAAADQLGATLDSVYQTVAPPVVYAGFWLRFLAYLIDWILLNIVGFFIGMVCGALLPKEPAQIVAVLIAISVNWLYFATLESSEWQATLGKRALNLAVTDLNGQRISFARATGRFFGKVLSGCALFGGFIMIAFTEQKQGLHDMLADTLVIRRA